MRHMPHRANRFATDFNDQSEEITEELVIPESFNEFSDEALNDLHAKAVEQFDNIYGDGKSLTSEDVDVLAQLTEGIEHINEELSAREVAATERAEQAAELAARAGIAKEHEEVEETDDEAEESSDDESEAVELEEEEEEEEEEPVTAAAPRREIRLSVSRTNSRHLPRQDDKPKTMKDVVTANGSFAGYADGQGVDFNDLAVMLDARLRNYNHQQYERAHRSGKHIKSSQSFAVFHNPSDPELTINSNDPDHINTVLSRATSEARLPQQSLTASGGWCAPSETLWNYLEQESMDGLYDLPEVRLNRGGIRRTLGPDFKDIFANDFGFHFTEEQDIAGDYDGDGGGTKPCYKIECFDGFEEFRLDVDGLCIQAGLLQARAFPELVERMIRGILVAHAHHMSAKRIQEVADGSTKVTMPGSAGSLVPILSAVEKQVEHMRYIRRLARNTTFEAVFPYWIRPLIRDDLARRNGTEWFNITDAQITAWFATRHIAPQFVYNWQDITGEAAEFTNWAGTVQFLIYPAGTWIRGTSDIITMDNLMDSSLLGTNDFTALFTEEGSKIIKMDHESRLIEVPVCTDGAYSASVEFACDGSVAGEVVAP